MWKAADPNLITAVDFINIVANDNEKEIGSTAADFVRDDFYVDDGLKSIPSVGEAVKLIKDVKEMCKRGGFNLHKFVSNNKEVIHSIPTEARAEDIKNHDLEQDFLPVERALQWCIENDSFNFRSNVSTEMEKVKTENRGLS